MAETLRLRSSMSSAILIDAAQRVGKSLQHAFQSRHDLGELLQRAAAVEFLRIMGHGLNAKHTFAFAIAWSKIGAY
jgi:hypothetical protein